MKPRTVRQRVPARSVPALCLLATIAVTFDATRAQDPDPQTLIDLVLKSREALKSGVFTATVVRRETSRAGEKSVSSSEIRCIFDSPKNLLAFNRRGHMPISVTDAEDVTPQMLEDIRNRTLRPAARLRPFRAGLVRNLDYMVDWHAIGNRDDRDHATSNIHLRDPETGPTAPFSTPLNPDWAGAATDREIFIGESLREVLQQPIRGEWVPSVVKAESGDVELVFAGPRVRRTFRISPQEGYTCKQMESVSLDDEGMPLPASGSSAKAEWLRVKGVWVPVSMTTECFFGGGSQRIRQYRFNWEQVNPESLDGIDFSYGAIEGIWEGLSIYERRNGQSKNIGTYHKGNPIIER